MRPANLTLAARWAPATLRGSARTRVAQTRVPAPVAMEFVAHVSKQHV